MMHTKVFYSSAPDRDNYTLEVVIDTEIPKLTIGTRNCRKCVLIGEDIGKLIAWLKEQDYKLP